MKRINPVKIGEYIAWQSPRKLWYSEFDMRDTYIIKNNEMVVQTVAKPMTRSELLAYLEDIIADIENGRFRV